MTALTMPARPDQDDARLRPVPWRRMAGVTWRQHRYALAGVAVLLGALAVWLWIIGTPLHHAYAAAIACHPASSPACVGLDGTFQGMDNLLTGPITPGGVFLQVVPVLIGAFAGAPVLAREMETGTFRYAWTQGLGRWRWALAKLVLLAVVLAAAGVAFSVLLSWFYQPYFAPGNQALGPYANSPFAWFNLREVAFPAWILVAFAGRARRAFRWKQSRSAFLGTATRSGPSTSRPAGSGHSSGSRAAGSSRCPRCSSPQPSGWSAAAPPDAARPVRPLQSAGE